MSDSLRRVVGVLFALAAAFFVVWLIDSIAIQANPLPEGIDPTDPVHLREALEAGVIPMVSLGLMTAGWWLAAYVGGRIASRVGRWGGSVWIFVLIFTAAVWMNLNSLPHPMWMWIAGLAGCPLIALAAGNQPLKVSAG